MKQFKDFWKREISKPGQSVHTAKFDRCVEQVKASGSADNPYAVCMAALGSEALKNSETEEEEKAVINEYIERLNIGSGIREKDIDIKDAGRLPISLLARQDIETEKHIVHEGDNWNLYSIKTGKLLGRHKTKKGAEAQEEAIKAHEAHEKEIPEEHSSEAIDSLDESEKETLAQRIKRTQIKRQERALSARGALKSFKEVWKESIH